MYRAFSCLGLAIVVLLAAVAIRLVISPTLSNSPPVVTTAPHDAPECQYIHKDDHCGITLKHLALLQYSHEGERKQLRKMKTIAGSWRDLGILFGYDVDQIAQNHIQGKGYVENCCQEVLTLWLSNGAQGYPTSWQGFIKALRDIELSSIALDIEDALEYCVAG